MTRPTRFLRPVALLFLSILAPIATAWAFGALWYDFPVAGARQAIAILFAAAALAAVAFLRPWGRAMLALIVAAGLVAAWWFTIKPRADRDWQPDVARQAWAEIEGDSVTIHEVRNFDYRTADDYSPRWETRTVRLSQIAGVDIAVNFWGSPWIAHPIVSFRFADAPPLCFSIEIRREIGEEYSALAGLFRQYELIYLAADERDVIRVRTNYRNGEDVFLYRMRLSPRQVRDRFLEYLRTMNAMRERPRWYHAITTNCTTSIRAQHPAAERPPWDWRLLLNGKGDELMFEQQTIETAHLPFAELKARAHINQAAKAADTDPDFSRRIREGRPGFP